MISLHFTTRLPGFTLEADCDLPGDGFTAVLGPSSCGKSTLTGSIADLVKPASGTISVNGRVFRSDDPCIDLPVESRGIGFVFQSHRLFPHLTVRKNLLFGRRLGGRRTAVDQERLIEVLGIAHLLSRRPDTLSGGESQRVALGRGILATETLLIMDEPLASLDSERKAELLGYFERIPEITGIPVLYITHAADEAERLAKTVLTMKDGRIADIRDESAVVHMTVRPVRGAEADTDVKAFMDFLASESLDHPLLSSKMSSIFRRRRCVSAKALSQWPRAVLI